MLPRCGRFFGSPDDLNACAMVLQLMTRAITIPSNDMRNQTKAQKLWKKIDGRIQEYDPIGLRQFYAASAKFLIPRNHWDDPAPATGFDSDPTVLAFHGGFLQFSQQEMLGDVDVSRILEYIKVLRQASGWGGKDLKSRTAKKKLTCLSRRMAKRFQHLIRNQENPLDRLDLYDGVLREKYLMNNPPPLN
jgi:hypothetical protein